MCPLIGDYLAELDNYHVMSSRQPTPGKRIITNIILVYCSLIVVWFLLRLLLFDRFWPLAIVNTTAVTKFPFPPQELAIQAIVDWNGQPLHIFVVHLSANNFFDNPLAMLPQLAQERYGYRADQLSRLAEEVTAVSAPIILMCDCNMTDSSEAYAKMDSMLEDSFWQAGQGLGHTLYSKEIPFRVQRVDYVWYSDAFTAVDAIVGQHGESDHHPIISTLTLNSHPLQEAQE